MDKAVLPYIKNFINNNIDGPKLLALQQYDFERIGVRKVGHQELIMEPLELLKHFVSKCNFLFKMYLIRLGI